MDLNNYKIRLESSIVYEREDKENNIRYDIRYHVDSGTYAVIVFTDYAWFINADSFDNAEEKAIKFINGEDVWASHE